MRQGFDVDSVDLNPSKRPCEPDIRGANRSMVFVADAQTVETLHDRFYADTLSKDAIANLRAQKGHFQRMEPANRAINSGMRHIVDAHPSRPFK